MTFAGEGSTGSDFDVLVVRRNSLDETAWQEQLFATAGRVRAATGDTLSWFDASLADAAKIVAV